MMRTVFAQHHKLFIGSRRVGERLVAIIVERQSWIRIAIRRKRHGDLTEVGVNLTPERGAPSCVEPVEASIFIASPFLKSGAAIFAVTAAPTLQRELVVDLPAD